MDFEKLTALMDWMSASPLAELEWSDGDRHIRLVKATATGAVTVQPTPAGAQTLPVTAAAATPVVAQDTVKAPYFGMVHLTPSPDAPPFVVAGQAVKAGDTLCVIEAMKVFSNVEAEADGVVREVLVKSGADVAIGQPLFRISA